jgi:hypothetical protein
LLSSPLILTIFFGSLNVTFFKIMNNYIGFILILILFYELRLYFFIAYKTTKLFLHSINQTGMFAHNSFERRTMMCAITGITRKVGGELVSTVLTTGAFPNS